MARDQRMDVQALKESTGKSINFWMKALIRVRSMPSSSVPTGQPSLRTGGVIFVARRIAAARIRSLPHLAMASAGSRS